MRMIEKMARAAFRDRYPEDVARWEDESPEDQLSYQGNMRAAVETMMEPSEAVLAAGVQALIDAGLDSSDGVGPTDAKMCFLSMRRAILDEK